MNEFTVPSWNLSHQRRQEVAGEEGNRSSSHVHNQPHHSYVVPMSNNEVAELIWENGQLAMHGLTPILQAPASAPEKAPIYGIASDTLESVVHHATCYKHNEENAKQLQETTNQAHVNPTAAATSGRKRPENVAGNVQMAPAGIGKKKRRSSESDQCGTYNFSNSRLRSLHEDQAGGAAERGACASASATFCREKDTTMMTWASFESPGSLKTRTTDEDSASQDGSENRDEDQLETKGETVRSHSARRSRAAIIHNQSERRRRDRINQKIKALQKLVPNASKTDKASMLDEVIEYLKQLQAQVHMMSTRNMPHQMMMNPLAMQQQLQMSLLARTGMGVGLVGTGMGMLDMNNLARSSSRSLQPGLVAMTPLASATPTFVPPHFVLPAAAVPTCNPFHTKSPVEASTNTPSAAFADPYTAFLSQQSMNMDFYKKMAALHRQEAKQATQTTSHPSQANFI